MLSKLEAEIRKRPLTWLALGAGSVAIALLARQLASSQKMPEQWQREVGRLRESGAHLIEEGTRGARQLKQHAGDIRSSLEEGTRGARQLKQHAGDIRSSLEDGVTSSQSQGVLPKVSNHESALAAFTATILAKGVSSYFRWRECAREQEATSRRTQGVGKEEDLEQMTVAQLRREASEQEIEGRSTMKKDELVDALKNET